MLLVGNPALPLKGFDVALAALSAVNRVLPLRVGASFFPLCFLPAFCLPLPSDDQSEQLPADRDSACDCLVTAVQTASS